MAFVSGIRSSARGRTSRLVWAVTVLMSFMASLPVLADDATKTATTQSQVASCPKPHGTIQPAIFRDVKAVNFYLLIPHRMEKAIQCHGDEIPCSRGDPEHRQHLIADYNAYPTVIHPDKLTTLFVERIQKTILPFVQKDDQCHAPTVTVISKKSIDRINQPDTLTVMAKLTIDDDVDKQHQSILESLIPTASPKRRIAVVSVYLFRPGCQYSSFNQTLDSGVNSGGSVIPLDLSESEIEGRLKYLLDHSYAFSVGADDGKGIVVDDILIGGHRHEVPKQ